MDVSYKSSTFEEAVRKCFATGKLKPKTVGSYVTHLRGMVRITGSNTLKELLELSVPTIIEKLDTAVNEKGELLKSSTRCSYLNAIIAYANACELPESVNAKLDLLRAENTKRAKDKMKAMEDNVGDAIPVDFDEKVKAYITKNEGTKYALLIAMTYNNPVLRGHMFEGTLIVRGKKTFDRNYAKNESPLMGIIDKTTAMFGYITEDKNKVNQIKPATAKVSNIRQPIKYTGEVVKQLAAYIKPKQKYLFPNGRGSYITSGAINEQIKLAYQDAGLPNIGTRQLRRIAETRNETDLFKTVAQKTEFSHQMNHSRAMGTLYNVVSKRDNPNAQKQIDTISGYIQDLIKKMPHVPDNKLTNVIELFDALDKRVTKMTV